jgi:hypothetical protein
MGCHTWCYTKIKIDDKLVDKYFRHFTDFAGLKTYEINVDFEEKGVPEDLKEALKNYNNLDWKFFELLIDKDNQKYLSVDYHDPFRIYGYPEVFITSFEKLKEFVEKLPYKNEWGDTISYDCSKAELLKDAEDFWVKYPEGAVEFQ